MKKSLQVIINVKNKNTEITFQMINTLIKI